MKNFLDSQGLTTYDQNIKDYIDNIVETDIAPAIDTKADDAVFGASGSSHSKGLVPDPGTTSGSTKFLREDGTWAVPAGGSGGGGGDINVIESISVNNVVQTVDANKNVNITVPAVASLIADNETGYTTGDQVYDYIQANKGDANVIESISVNGSAQTITNKSVNITVPTVATAIADSDTGYATGDQVYDYVQANKGDTNVIESISVNGTTQTITNKGVNITVPVAGVIASGNTGYVTGDQVYDTLGDLETFLASY